MAIPMAAVGAVADPRLGDQPDFIGTSRDTPSHQVAAPDTHGHHNVWVDPNITFEQYVFWAERSREYEKHLTTGDAGLQGGLKVLMGKKPLKEKPHDGLMVATIGAQGHGDRDEKLGAHAAANGDGNGFNKEIGNGLSAERTNSPPDYGVEPAEWEQAQRATRTATWGSIFYLITTDIL